MADGPRLVSGGCVAMEDYEVVLVREPVRLNLVLFLTVLGVSYVVVCLAVVLRVYLRVGRGPGLELLRSPKRRRAAEEQRADFCVGRAREVRTGEHWPTRAAHRDPGTKVRSQICANRGPFSVH